jgi:hypothetical protein
MQPVDERSHDLGERIPATVQEAAAAVGIGVEAVRSRMHRGKYQKEKDDEGQVFVLLPHDQLPNVQGEVKKQFGKRLGSSLGDRSYEQSRTFGTTVYKRKDDADTELVEELRGKVAYLKEIIITRDEELRRKDTIIMQIAQRIPELEALQEFRGSPETSSKDDDGEEVPSELIGRRSWWRIFFGG